MKCLYTREMLELLHNEGHSEAYAKFAAKIEAVTNEMAAMIAETYNVAITPANTDFYETAARFGPLNPGDTEPDAFTFFDQSQPWE